MGRGIPESERGAVWRLLGYSMILGCSYILTRTVGDSLFLARVGSHNLAGIYVASGITTAVIASAWYALTWKLSLELSLRLSGLVFSAIGFAAWFALPSFPQAMWLLAGIYLFAEIKGCVNAINIVSAINDVMGGHSSRQSWARIGLGLPLAGIFIGSLLGLEANFFSLRSWLLLAALLDLLGVIPVWSISKHRVPQKSVMLRSRDAVASMAQRFGRRIKSYANSRQFQFWIGCLIATKVAVLTMVSFEWKTTVSDFYDGDEQSLTRYFGLFAVVTGVITLLLQAFIAGPLLRRRRVAFPILVMPVALLALNAMFVLGGGVLFLMVVTTLAKLMEVWRRSIHDTTLSFLYTKIDREKRRGAIALNSGLVKPLAEVSASLTLLFASATFQESALLTMTGFWLLSTVPLVRLIVRIERENELRREQRRARRTAASEAVAGVSPD